MAASKEEIRDALDYIPADDREVWVAMGMAVKSELGGDGFSIWDKWSQGAADKYDPKAAAAVWKSIDASGPTGIGTLFHEAKQHGYRPRSKATVDRSTSNGAAPRAPQAPDKAIKPHEVARYTYTDELREPVMQVRRLEYPALNGSKPAKSFAQYRPDGAGGWLAGIKGHNVRSVPYRLADLLEALTEQTPVFIVEGEKKVEALFDIGVPATCNVGGAGKWQSDWSAIFRGADVVLLPDNDTAGRDHMDKVADNLRMVTANIRVLAIPGLPEKGDIVDWLEAGGTAEKLYALLATEAKAPGAKPSRFDLRTSETSSGPILKGMWLVKGVIPRQGIGAMFGKPGCGKTFVANDLALHLASGLEWRGLKTQGTDVAYMSMEAGAGGENRIHSWLLHHNRKWPKGFVMSPVTVDLRSTKERAAEFIAEVSERGLRIGFMVVDTLARAMCGGNENASEDMGQFIDTVEWMAKELSCFVLLIHHSGKDEAKGLRGHTSLLGAINTEIEIRRERGKPGLIVINKQRDGKDGTEFGFDLAVETLGYDEDEDAVTSCVAVEVDAAGVAKPRRGRPSAGLQVALDALIMAIGDAGEVPQGNGHIPTGVAVVSDTLWRKYHYQLKGDDAPETKKKSHQRAKEQLLAGHFIGIWGEQVWKI